MEQSVSERGDVAGGHSEVFRLPDLGEGLTEAELVSWTVAVGDRVELNQVIAEVETAKATVELPSPYAGTVAELLAEPGDSVPVGNPLIRFTLPGAGDGGGPVQVLVGYGPGAAPASKRAARAAAAPSPQAPAGARHRPDAKPSARREARELGVDLTGVTGTGAGGVITVPDVRRAAEARDTQPPEAGPPRETRTPIHGIRRRTAAAVARSAFTAPHVTVFLTCDVTATVELVSRLRGAAAFEGRHPTPLTVVAKALLRVLAHQPVLNAAWDEEHQEIVTRHYVNLGIATATDAGLMVPVIHDADRLSLPDLADAVARAAETARSGRATPAELTGGTVSITNVGVFGVDTGTPILNPGETAILALGAIGPRPWVVDGELAVRQVTTLSLSFDHRLVDGEQAARALAEIGAILTDPVPELLAGI
ncbi:branched-chain alpha-keto acid dehydrogenase subunit E2 [Rhodococcus ruber Chol-4]|uniref:dihydrolipoamide acetyltransferase family protein n=2 Tax=Rhodococcus ruber TaxID=1830 RepID=UPI00076BA6B7|nr:dihydrolipoamide acetyltransferase family protein [Rhodococcus ruber]AWG98583.1 2-oxo acid dehydrogenase subunit E2 [Rhodococcus ruber]KXF88322.1 branched-chain alpha-keto acid dehydrogenase subunit E2 [Rhodococcus ruber Chol-4]